MMTTPQQKDSFTNTGHIVILNGATFEISGVNFYILNIAKALKKKGYRVTVICQDRNAKQMPQIDQYIQGELPQRIPRLRDGQIRVIIPDVGGIIPIYASFQCCEFQGMKSKVIQQMTEQQIKNNIQLTKKCLRDVCEHDRPLKGIANYMLLSGIIAAGVFGDYKVPYDIIVPGPALMYTVKPYPHLWKWVFPGFKKASTIFQHTQFVKIQFLKCFKNHIEEFDLDTKVKAINPGIDINENEMPESYPQCEREFLLKVQEILVNTKNGSINSKLNFSENMTADQIHDLFTDECKIYNQLSLEADLLEKWVPYKEEDQTIVYIGAMINNKGMGELLAMAPKLISERPTLKFIFCGSGPYKTHMYELVNAFEQGNFAKAKLIAQAGQFITEINIQDYFFKADRSILKRIIFCGLTSTSNHLLRNLLPLCTVYVVPSKILESCSIGIMKAMSYGVTPICNDHSWMAEVNNVIQKDYPELSEITRVDRSQFFQKLPQTIINTLNFIKQNKLSKSEYQKKIRQIVVNNYSWEHLSSVLAEERQFKQIRE